MSYEFLGIAGFILVLVLALFRVPVAISMAFVGGLGALYIEGWQSSSYVISSLPFDAVHPYGLSIVPLFIFMGVFSTYSGLSKGLYKGIYALIGHFRGGIAMATVGACAVFGAICGSSLATVATMGKVAMPEMAQRSYAKSLASASVAAGGTLGVLIPPSILLVLYALMTEQSIGALFAAAMIPGLIATVLYVLVIFIQVKLSPEKAPKSEKMPWGQLFSALLGMWDAILLVSVVIGGIYSGLFSPTEAAAVGSGGALAITALKKQLTFKVLIAGMTETAKLTGMIFLILIGATIFNYFIEVSRLPEALVRWIEDGQFSPTVVIVLIVLFYVVLGCFMASLSMLLLTVTPLYNLVVSIGFDPVWFGVLLVSVAEIGLITPPIGMNLFVVLGVDDDLTLKEVSSGILPFIVADVVRVILMIAFPVLCLWLPYKLGFLL